MQDPFPDPGLGCWPVTLPLRLSSFFVLKFWVVHGGEIWEGGSVAVKIVLKGICEHKCTSALTFKSLLQQAALSPGPV